MYFRFIGLIVLLLAVFNGPSAGEEQCTSHQYQFRAIAIDNEVQLFIDGQLILKGFFAQAGNTLEGKFTKMKGPGDTGYVDLTPFLNNQESTLTIRSINYPGCCEWGLNAAVWQDGQLFHHKHFQVRTCAPRVHDEVITLPKQSCTTLPDPQAPVGFLHGRHYVRAE